MRAITEQQKQEAIAAFAYEGTLIADTVYGSGHINDTFRLTFAVGNMGDILYFNISLRSASHPKMTETSIVMAKLLYKDNLPLSRNQVD